MRAFEYHKSLETISIYRLNKIKESITGGKPDYRHLLKLSRNQELPTLGFKQVKILENAYMDLFAEMEDVSVELVSLYRIYLESYLQTKINIARNELLKLQGAEYSKVSFSNHNRDFMNYIHVLNRDYTNFRIVEYFIPENYEEIFKDKFQDIELNKDFQIFFEQIEAFYTIDRYVYEIENLNVSSFHKNVFLLPEFLEVFVRSREISITDLIPYVDRLQEEFKLNNNYEGYIEFRHKAFGLNNFYFEPGHVNDFYDEVIRIKQILGFDFDIHQISAKEYMGFLKAIKARAGNEMTKDKAK